MTGFVAPASSWPSHAVSLNSQKDASDWLVDEGQDPDRHADTEAERALAGALACLSQVQLEAVRLVVLERESYREAGQILGVSRMAVHRRVHGALAVMRVHLEQQQLDLDLPETTWETVL